MKTSGIYLLSLLLTATLATGCQKEQRTGITPGKETTVTLPGIHIRQEQFIMPEFQTSANTLAAAEGDDTCPFTVSLQAPTAEDSLRALTKADVSFSNLWVFQFGADGNVVKSEQVASLGAGENISVTLTAGTDYTIGLVANAPSDFSSSAVTTLDQFRSGALFTHASITPDALPYAGDVSGVTVYDDGSVEVDGQDVPTIMVERVTAEVTVNLTYGVSGYELDGLEMYSVPLKGAYSNSSETYPAAEAGNFSYMDNAEKGLVPQKTEGSQYTWYIQANRRGSVASITAQQQKNVQNAPQYATYVRVKTHMTDTYNALYYDIYLGENLLSNFDVTGNHTYTYQTRIAGFGPIHQLLPETDPRVTATMVPHIVGGSVEPDPTTVAWDGGDYTVTLEGFWQKDVPVRVYSGSSALVEGSVAYLPNASGGSTVLKVPQNAAPNPERALAFQYQWEGQWKEIAGGTQQERPFYVEKATVSPDPTNFSSAATAFTVTLTGAWESAVPVRAIIDGNSVALVSGSVTTSGKGVSLTVPANSYPNPARTIVFQYQWDNKWVEIDRGTQAAGENIDQGGGTEISPDTGSKMTWDQAIAYCKSKGTGWRLPTQNELMYLWCLAPSFTGKAAFAADNYWSATQNSSNSTYAWHMNFSSGYTYTNSKTNGYYVRCVRDK